MLPFQNAELLPRRKVFQDQITARAKTSNDETEQEPQKAEHTIS
jgi:hypothetical protein